MDIKVIEEISLILGDTGEKLIMRRETCFLAGLTALAQRGSTAHAIHLTEKECHSFVSLFKKGGCSVTPVITLLKARKTPAVVFIKTKL